jgi:hypothetical protein
MRSVSPLRCNPHRTQWSACAAACVMRRTAFAPEKRRIQFKLVLSIKMTSSMNRPFPSVGNCTGKISHA